MRCLCAKLLLHLCCGVCGTVGWKSLSDEGYEVIGYFDGGNIHPYEEMVKRLEAADRLARSLGCRLIHRGWNPQSWDRAVEGYENQPEGGARCTLCMAWQLDQAAMIAREVGCTYLCTSLTLSPHKDPTVINQLGQQVACRYGLMWVERLWRKRGGIQIANGMAAQLGLYRQNWCGCRYSMEERFGKRKADI